MTNKKKKEVIIIFQEKHPPKKSLNIKYYYTPNVVKMNSKYIDKGCGKSNLITPKNKSNNFITIFFFIRTECS